MAAEDLPPPHDTTASPTAADDDDDDLFGTNDEDTPQPKTEEDGGVVPIGGIEIIDSNSTTATPTPITQQMLNANPPPQPLPLGWFLKPSHSSPTNYYYFNQDTGECRWEYPVGSAVGAAEAGQTISMGDVAVSQESLNATAAAAAAAVKSILKRSPSATLAADAMKEGGATAKDHTSSPPPPSRKRAKTSSDRDRKEKDRTKEKRERHHHHHTNEREPKEVRVLHILKKHRGSRRPASWRNPKISDSKEKAICDLRELIAILNESSGDHKEVRATFEELAKTESDCSSAKRGGDLGFFGRKKMQPAFEKASFGLRVGQLSDIVDTSSGVHVILRLA
mmetsp:Transcript_24030/g.43111  ORF Transcript_24030/g.43111 Transcript_24030/m.43111 type:complete len:337 (+) Transcript_24030:26-1036(+)